MKVVKWFVLSLVILLVLALAGMGIIIATVDPNDYKDEISAQVKKASGRDLTLEGDIAWSLFPSLGLNLGKATLANAPGFSGPPLASVEEVKIHVALLPLLKKQVEVQTLVVRGLALNLEKNKAGKGNWEGLSGGSEAGSAEKEKARGGGTSALSLNIEGVKILGASLVFDDKQAGSKIEIAPFNLRTGAIAMAKPVLVELDVLLKQADTTLTLDLVGMLTADIESGVFSAHDLVLKTSLEGASIPGGKFTAVTRMNVKANTGTQKIKISELSIDASGVAIQGTVEVSDFVDAPAVLAELSSNSFSPRELMTEMGMKVPLTTDESVLSKVSFSLTLKGDQKQLSIKPLKAVLDDSRLEGALAITDLARQAISFDLTLNQIDLDRYLPPIAAAGNAGDSPEASAASDAIALPLGLLKRLDVVGSARIEKLVVSKLTFTNASLSVIAKKGLLEVKPLIAHAYSGKAEISASLDVRGSVPAYAVNVDLKGVQSADILQVLAGDRYVSGTANFDASISTQGDSVTALKQALEGEFQAKFSEGTVRGSELGAKIIEAVNFLRKLQGRGSLSNVASDETHFSVLSASGVIAKGVVTNNDLQMIAPVLQVKGNGSVNLPAASLDYRVMIGLPPKEGKDRHFVPLKIKGPFSDLKLKLAVEEVAKAELERKKAELKAEIRTKADAEKAKLKLKAEEEKAKLKAKANEKKGELQKEAKEKLKAKENELKKKLEEELGDTLKGLFQ